MPATGDDAGSSQQRPQVKRLGHHKLLPTEGKLHSHTGPQRSTLETPKPTRIFRLLED